MKTLLVTHPWMGRGGSEATAMWTLMALQDLYEVTFVSASPIDWDDLNEVYGTAVDPGKVRFLRAKKLPSVNNPHRLAHAQLRYFESFCRGIAGDFDGCVSAYHPIDFGRPGVQLIGDFSFSEEMRRRLYIHGEEFFVHRETTLRKLYLWASSFIGREGPPLCERGDLVLANSQWCADQLKSFFALPEAPVLYPPVILPKAPASSERDPLGFACLGRIVPEKEIERMVRILEMVREKGYPVTLRLIGALDSSDYSKRVEEMVRAYDWITPEGQLAVKEKQEILAGQSFAIHGCRIEAFGIAVAEMASMGCIPFVPDCGGAGEIISLPELQYGGEEEAVEKILRLLDNPEKVEGLRQPLISAMDRFGPKTFMRSLQDHVLRFIDSRSERDEISPQENLAAVS